MRVDAEIAIVTAVETLLGSNVPIVYPNVKTTVAAGCQKWASISHLPAPSKQATLGPKGLDMISGIVQVSLHYPIGSGHPAAVADADSFANAFWDGRALTYNGQETIVDGCNTSGGKETSSWYVQHLSINWHAHVVRGG